MKRAACGALALGILISLSLLSAAKASTQETPLKPWALIWSDEFDGKGTLDLEKWNIREGGGGFGNNELQHYTSRPENLRQENGNLVIEARKENFGGDHYTSGRIFSRATLTYGRVEIRAKMASGQGVWPALWMMAVEPYYGGGLWPDNGEIDIAEYVGRDPQNILSCFYTKNANWMNGKGHTANLRVPTAEIDFHVYALEWTPDFMEISVDGQVFNRFDNPRTDWRDWPFDRPFHVILNLALGGYGGDVDDAIFPQKTLIDYVRLYQQL